LVAVCSTLAGEVRLCEHDDYDQFVIAAAERFNIAEPFIEKDYHLTEALRVVAATHPKRIIFKGGTSLSKRWKLIRRFSEDIDLYVRPTSPPQAPGGVDRDLRALKRAVEQGVPSLTHTDTRVSRGRSRLDVFSYDARFQPPAGLPATIQLEPGVQGGDLPSQIMSVHSYIAQTLDETGINLNADDVAAFEIHVLHFSRTFIEKLFAVHGLVARLQRDGTPLGRDARHYYDLHALAAHPEVLRLLESDEGDAIREDVDRVCREFYPDRYEAPDGLRLGSSPAVEPTAALRAQITEDYDRECQRLCYDEEYAEFDAVIARLQGLAHVL
jgi:Nucleotidyl transferase AbiEii toxin, Type IV TA system